MNTNIMIQNEYHGELSPAHYARADINDCAASRCAVARDGDAIVGSVFFAPYGSKQIAAVYVDGGYRRQGIGSALVKTACEAMGIEPAQVLPSVWYSDEGRALANALGYPTEMPPKVRPLVERWVNLTPHVIRIRHIGRAELETGFDGEEHIAEPRDAWDTVVQPEDVSARVAVRSVTAGRAGGFPVYAQERGAIEGLPEPAPGVGYLVSLIVLDALRDAPAARLDVYAPATGPRDGAIRTKDGQVFAVVSLVGLPL